MERKRLRPARRRAVRLAAALRSCYSRVTPRPRHDLNVWRSAPVTARTSGRFRSPRSPNRPRSSCRCSKRWSATTSRTGRSASSGRSYIRSYAQAIGLDPRPRFASSSSGIPGQVEPPSRPVGGACAHAGERPAAGRRRGSRSSSIRRSTPFKRGVEMAHHRAAERGHRRRRSNRRRPSPIRNRSRRVSVRRHRPDSARSAAAGEPSILPSVAHLCTRLACAQEAEEVTAALEEAACCSTRSA